MTNPDKPGIVERLTRKRKFRIRDDGPTHTSLVNPDGPEAAAIITELVSALEFLLGQFDQAHVAHLMERSPSGQAAIVQAKAALAKARS